MSNADSRSTLKVLGRDGYRILKAVVDRIVPQASAKHEMDLALKIDSIFSNLGKEFGRDFKILLAFFEYGAPIFGFTFKRFTQMNPEEQDRYLAGWERSRLAFKRMGFQALKRTTLSAFYGSEESWPAIGYRGPWLNQGYPPDYQGKGIEARR